MILTDGTPTIFSTNFTGRGHLHDVWVCDISDPMSDNGKDFIVSAHNGSDNILMLDVWRIDGYSSIDKAFRTDPQEFRNDYAHLVDKDDPGNN